MDCSIVGVSDVSVGFGSPEVPAILLDVCSCLQLTGTLIEPDEHDRPILGRPTFGGDHFTIEHVASHLPSHSLAWRREFVAKAAARIDQVDPDCLILFGGLAFSVLPLLQRRPRCVIYHAYEQINGLPPEFTAAHKFFLGDADLVVTPEIRRLNRDCARLGVWPKRVFEIWNSADVVYPDRTITLPAEQRIGRFFWSGYIDSYMTYSDYFTSNQLARFEIDMVGRINPQQKNDLIEKIGQSKNVKYHGLVRSDIYNKIRAESAFSLMWWNPHHTYSHHYLASNRLFSSILAGVPPIVGPHPQCIEISERYGCVMLLKDWSLQSLSETMSEAMGLFRTDQYAELVDRCHRASADLSWAVQSRKLVGCIAEVFDGTRR